MSKGEGEDRGGEEEGGWRMEECRQRPHQYTVHRSLPPDAATTWFKMSAMSRINWAAAADWPARSKRAGGGGKRRGRPIHDYERTKKTARRVVPGTLWVDTAAVRHVGDDDDEDAGQARDGLLALQEKKHGARRGEESYRLEAHYNSSRHAALALLAVGAAPGPSALARI